MRNFKFRIYTKRNDIKNNMCFVKSINFSNDEIICKHEYRFKFSETELMQYTGLKDSKGKEIYEGDIVKFDYRGLFLKGEVVFSNGGWELKGVDYGEHFRLIEIVHLCEVIGNIYENSELLK